MGGLKRWWRRCSWWRRRPSRRLEGTPVDQSTNSVPYTAVLFSHSTRRGTTSQLAINMSSKEQKTEVVAEEEVDAKKDVVVKGTKRPAEDKNDDIKKIKKAEENGDDEDVEDEEEAEGEEDEEEEDLPEGEEDFDEEGEGEGEGDDDDDGEGEEDDDDA